MKILLLLSVCWFLGEAQKPTIKMVPKYGLVYAGDTVMLKCSDVPSKWLFNGEHMPSNTERVLTLPAVSKDDNGHYQCENSTGMSDQFNITVLEYLPPAFLTVSSEYPVVNNDQSVLLKLSLDEDLTGWKCYVVRQYLVYNVRIPAEKMDGKNSTEFYVSSEGKNPAIVFCKHNRMRSNSVLLRSSNKEVLLEVPPEPVVLGEPLTLRCVVQGGAAIRKAVFYKDDVEVHSSTNDGLYSIPAVTYNDKDSYICQADYQYTFTKPHGAWKTGVESDPQTITIRARPPTARIISNNRSLECSCADCPSSASFNWYYRDSSAARKGFYLHTKGTSMLYHYSGGEYFCRGFWEYGASGLSKPKNTSSSSPSNPLWILFIALVLVVLGAVIVVILYRKKRGANITDREDMQMKSVSKRRRRAADGDEEDAQDDAYQTLKGQEKTEYQTLPANPGDGGDGGYEAVGAARAGDGADGGYEALKVKGQSDVYHSLQQPSTSQGAEGGYEALKGNRQIDTYETLKQREAEGLGIDEQGLYQPLGATDGDGGYEELKAKRQGP